VLQLDSAGTVASFSEKPQLDGWVNIGYFVFEPRVFDYLKMDPGCVLEQEPLQKLARDGQLVAYRHEGFFFAMDTYREFKYLNELWDTGAAPWKVWP
jgi:glucose-1-phosphate cytidylyltransferase